MKRFKQFVCESEGLPKIYIEMDMVLADWLRGANKILEKNGYPEWHDAIWETYDEYQTDEIKWAILNKQENFYGSLKFMKEGKRLWKFVKNYEPIVYNKIDSRIDNVSDVVLDKTNWIKNKIGETEIVFDKSKCQCAINEDANPNLLITSSTELCKEFFELGGISILHDDAKTTIKELKKLGYR
jgi:hypothetical protein